jgi:hypothetical protein
MWVNESVAVGIEDLAVANDRPIHQVAADLLDQLGWV